MADMDGATATRAIRKQWENIQVVALTSFLDNDLVKSVLQAGAIGYLLKNVSADELAKAFDRARFTWSLSGLLRCLESLPRRVDNGPCGRYPTRLPSKTAKLV